MKKKKKIYSVFSFLLVGALCLSMTACSKTPTPAEDETTPSAPLSSALPVKALQPKQVDENPYMAKSDANIHHDGYNTDSTDEILPLGIYPEINVSYETTNANASPAIYFDSYGHAVVPLLGGIAMMLSMDWVLSLVLIALLPIIGIVVYFVTKTSVPLYTRQQSVLDQVVTVVQENITGIRVIKALSKTDYEKERFRRVNRELTEVDRKAGSVSAITNPAATLVLNLGLTLVVVAGAYRVSAGAVRSGVIVAFLQYFVMILNAMLGITKIFVMFSKGQASANRVASVLHAPEDLPLLPAADPIPGAPHIAFRNVTFSYNGREPDVENLTFSIGHGQTLGILGATGSGKTTLLLLLLRLYDPTEGYITLNGVDIRRYRREDYYRLFSPVFQNVEVMAFPVAENVSMKAREETDFRQAMNALREAGLGEKLEALPKGIETELLKIVDEEGVDLSGGEKQKLALARALYKAAPIVVLDEPTSALDALAEQQLYERFDHMIGKKSAVYISHRLASTRFCDRIAMFQDGHMIELGSHEELMAQGGEYAHMFEVQAQYYREEQEVEADA